MGAPPSFTVDWHDEAVEALRARIRGYEFPPAPPGEDWRYGTDATWLRETAAWWADGYDWPAAIARLNRHPQFLADIDDVSVHFVHVVGEAGGKRPLLLSHGWPGAHREFWPVIDALAYPSRHGGDASDAFDLVIPSLPNFGFSAKPEATIPPREVARLFDRLMTDTLGYARYRAHGGDWGALITSNLALHHAPHVEGIHLTMLFPLPAATPDSDEDRRWAGRMAEIEQAMGGYRHTQGSRPQSLSWLVGRNPVGVLAWIAERFHDWSDRRARPFEAIFPRDDLLDIVSIYAMENAFHSSIRFYAAARETGARVMQPGERVAVPTAFACFPDPLHPWPSRAHVERGYEVARWTTMPHGGHFAALEAPDLLVQDLRAWART